MFSGRFDTSGSMIRLSVPEIEGGSPERDGGEGEEGLVLEYSSSWISPGSTPFHLLDVRLIFGIFGGGVMTPLDNY